MLCDNYSETGDSLQQQKNTVHNQTPYKIKADHVVLRRNCSLFVYLKIL